ncbi:hypothetical protein [uncultured Clostridium sp.]|uniref:hypothetical protein n=1 Tax=uncultured Clostridium sp. TaxID=59620 RepID=UPI00261B4BA2|nr:hypothetical protein [uncultured Clostridium sp.]
MQYLDKQIEMKQFFKSLYAQEIVSGNKLKDNQYIRVFQNNKTNIEKDKIFSKIEFFNNIDDLVSYSSVAYGLNTYFTLATTKNKENGQEENLHTRYFLAWDFDKKDLGENFSCKDIVEKFKSIGLWYHVLVDSGHGYHAYTCIEPTQDIKKVLEVQKVLCDRLVADTNSTKTTQILRIPYTYNIKEKVKRVNIIKIFKEDTIKRYNIDKLYNKYCCNAKDNKDSRVTQYTINNTRLKPCVIDILKQGSGDGSRNIDLQKIVVSLRLRNKSKNDILHICTEWNTKNNPKMSDKELNYQVNDMYKNLHNASYGCKECKYEHDEKCFSKVVSDFEHTENEIIIENKIAKQLKYTSRKGVKYMNGNKLLIFNVMKNNIESGLYTDQIVKLITPRKGRCTLSKPVLIETLKSLVGDNTINKTKGNSRAGIKDFYSINAIKCDIDENFSVSYLATVLCINKVISTDELRLYYHMRYRQHLLVQEGEAQGNLYQVKQTELAKDLGVTQPRISAIVKRLIENHLLDIYYKGISKNNGFEYNIYKLNE